MSNCCWTTTTTTTKKKIEEDQYWLLKTSISKKGLFCRVVVSLAVCTGWSILEEGTLWIIWAAQPKRQPPLNITGSDFQCWTFFLISFLPFFFFYFILKANPPEMVVSQVHIFFSYFPLFFFFLSLPPYLTHRGNMQSRDETSRESKKSLIHPLRLILLQMSLTGEGRGV